MAEHPQPTYEELQRRLANAEAALQALRDGQVDTIVAEHQALVVRHAEAETREQHIKQVLLAIRNVNQLIVEEDDPKRLIERACASLTETVGYHNAWIALRNESHESQGGRTSAHGIGHGFHAIAASGFDGQFDAMRARLVSGELPSCTRQALARDKTVVVEVPSRSCSDCPLSAEYRGRAGFCRRLAHGGSLFGILAVSVPAAYVQHEEEQGLFEELASDLAFALYKIETTQRLQESQRRYLEIFEGSRDGFVMVDAQRRILDANRAYCDMLGYSIDELRALPDFYQITAQRWRQWEQEEIWEKRLLRDGCSGLYEKEYVRKDGTVFPVELRSYVVRRADGTIDYFWGTVRDITDRKRSEEAVTRTTQRLRLAADAAEFGIWDLDLAKNRLDWDEGLFRLYGVDPEIFGGDYETWQKAVHPDDLERASREVDLAIQTGERFDTEFRVIRPNGSVRIVKANALVVKDAEGQPVRMTGVNYDITTQRHAEETLQKSAHYLKTILQTTADGFLVIDNQGYVVDTNDAYCAMSGYPRDELIGMSMGDLDVDETPAETQARIRRVVANGSELFEARHRRKDGSVFPVEVSTTFLGEHDGQSVCFCRDLTERKRHEARIVLLGRMLDAAPAAITIHDTQGRFIYANRETVELHGYDDEQSFLAVNLHDLDVPESEALLAERFRRIAGEGEARFEVVHRCKDGSTFPLEVLAKQIKWDDQPAILSIAADITERNRAEEALRHSRAQLSNALKMGRMGHWELDVGSGVFTFSDSFYAMLHTTAAEMGGYEMSVGDYARCFVHPDDSYRVAEETRKAIEASTPDYSRYLEHRMLYADGSDGHVAVRFFVVKDQSGKTIKTYGVNQDITERKKVEEEQKRLQSQLIQAQKMESVGRLAGGVAHDFNNMLGVILGHTEMAMEQVDPSQPLHGDLEEIRKAAVRSADLTRQLLAFARKQTIAPRVLDLNQTVAGMLKMLRRLIGEDIDLVWKPGHALWPVKMDPSQIDQALANLCVNARDSISGVGRVTIETQNTTLDEVSWNDQTTFTPGDYVLLSVSDSGCGMDQETLAHLFEPFFTTKAVGKGTGLGLATVYGIIKQNHGGISVDSQPGQGTSFKIYLPRHQSKAELMPETRRAQPAAGGSETILLTEDEPEILRMATKMLKSLGYAVLPAKTPGEAIRLAEGHSGPIDLLMTDVIMPEMNGRDLAKNILRLYPDLKRLFMSGYTARCHRPPWCLGRRRQLHPEAVPEDGSGCQGEGDIGSGLRTRAGTS